MTTPDERRAYQRGYSAGRRRKAAEVSAERRRAQREAFRQRAFLAALPFCLGEHAWKLNQKPCSTLDERLALAEAFANGATARMVR